MTTEISGRLLEFNLHNSVLALVGARRQFVWRKLLLADSLIEEPRNSFADLIDRRLWVEEFEQSLASAMTNCSTM